MCRNVPSSSIVEEHSGQLRSKLKELDGQLGVARSALSFRSLEGILADSFDIAMDQLSESTMKAELHAKLVKNLLSTMKS